MIININRELKSIEFFLNMDPPTKTFQDKIVRKTKRGRAIIHDSSDLKRIKAGYAYRLAQHKPNDPFLGPVELVLKWIYKGSSGESVTYKTTRPDVDNVSKLLMDCMAKAGFWKDDAQVASLVTQKFNGNTGNTPGVWVSAREVEM